MNQQQSPSPTRRILATALLLCLLLPSCVSFDYDLSRIAIPISAKPAPEGTPTKPLHIEARNVLWVHGLFGHEQPDIIALLAEESKGASSIANFRIRQTGSFHDWLITHLSLTLVRMKSVVIDADLLGSPGSDLQHNAQETNE